MNILFIIRIHISIIYIQYIYMHGLITWLLFYSITSPLPVFCKRIPQTSAGNLQALRSHFSHQPLRSQDGHRGWSSSFADCFF